MFSKVLASVLVGLAVLGFTQAQGLPQSSAEARAELLRNVRVINSGGVPGVVLCIGSNAFPVVGAKCGQVVQPVAAACFYGSGRALAVGHPSFCTEEGTSRADTAAFIKNGIGWLGQGTLRVAVYQNTAVAKALAGISGVSVREIPSLDALAGCPVLAVYPDNLHAEEVERVRAFILSGGGLLASGIGWGWQQVSGGKALATDNLFNRLLGPAGLLITSDIADRTGPNGFLTDFPIPAGVNISEALRLASSGTVSDAVLARQINHTLCAVKAVLPPQKSDLAHALDALQHSPAATKLPSPDKPLKACDIPARLALIGHLSAWRARPSDPWPAHPAAAYPGLPPAGTLRVACPLKVRLDIPRWHSTGLYAAAGEPVTVELPPGAEKLGLKLRIGTTTCDISRHDEWRRAPKVDEEVPLKTNVVTVSSPFGGLLYVVVPDKVDSAEHAIEVTLRNACRAVWFKEGRDTLTAWRTSIRTCPAPWAELESDKVILTVPSSVVRSLDDPSALLALWDKVADQDARLAALPPGRRSAERFCSDVQVCAGWMHAGYPIMIPDVTAKDLVNLDALITKGDWGFFHELGHNHQNADWTFGGTGEVTVNFFTLYNMEHLCGLPPRKTRMGEEAIQKTVRAWVAKGKPHDAWCRDPFLALETFVRLQQVFGWTAFEKLFEEYRTLPKEERPKSDAEKRGQWAVRLSRVTGKDIAAVFDAWNIPLSDEVRQACARYPAPTDPRLFDSLR